MKRIIYLIFILLLFSSIKVFGQEIDKVRATVEGTTIEIRYEIINARINHIFNIEVYYSIDNGNTFVGPIRNVSGDVGDDITAGTKKIVWDVFKEVDELNEYVVFEVRAEVIEREIKRPYYVALSTNMNAPFGINFGQLGEISWFATFRVHPGYFNQPTTRYECNDNEVIDFSETGYYEFSEERIRSRIAVLAGINYQYNQFLYFYGGVGYGAKDLYWHINRYSYLDHTKTGSEYVTHSDLSFSGVEAEVGCLYNYYRVVFTGSVSTLNFKRFDLNIGAGILF
jgi:hypothetical protein